MSEDRDFQARRVRLPGGDASAAQPDRSAEPVRARRDSLRRARRISNWTAAALIAGTGATTVALASHALGVGTSTASSSNSGATSANQGANAPAVNGAVTTSGGSGVTVTKQVVNGKVVITKTHSGSHNSDN